MIPPGLWNSPGDRYVRGLSRLHSPGGAKKMRQTGGIFGFFCMGNGITACNRVGSRQ